MSQSLGLTERVPSIGGLCERKFRDLAEDRWSVERSYFGVVLEANRRRYWKL
jgi:hypothetical protein